MIHTVRTTHIRRLIAAADNLAALVDQVEAEALVEVGAHRPGHEEPLVPVDHGLARAANLLRHAAEELEDERLACLGWAQP